MQAHVRGGDVDTPHGHVILVVLVIAAGADRVPIHGKFARDIEPDRTPIHFIHPVLLEHNPSCTKHLHFPRRDVDQTGIVWATVNSAGINSLGFTNFQQAGHVNVHLISPQAGCIDQQTTCLHRHFTSCVPCIIGQVNLAVRLNVEIVRNVQAHRAAVRSEKLEITFPLALGDGGTAGLQV